MKTRYERLMSACVENNCDVLGIRKLLHKQHYKYYEAFKEDILSRMTVRYDIKIESMN